MNKNSTPNPYSDSLIFSDNELEMQLKKTLTESSDHKPSKITTSFLSAYAAAFNCCKTMMAGDAELLMN